MEKTPIIIGSDHAGFEMKEFIKKELDGFRIKYKDVGAYTGDKPSDYPVYVAKVAHGVSAGIFKRGIAVCGAGMGAAIVANRFPHVRASLCANIAMARLARAHNDSNILCLGGRITPDWHAAQILDAWLTTPFEGGRHAKRVQLIDDTTQLSIAFGHLNAVNPRKVDHEAINQNLVKKAMKGLQKLSRGMNVERRNKPEERLPESCPAKINYEGKQYSALMLDFSEGGGQFRFGETTKVPPLIADDEVDISVKTTYGPSSCKGKVRWEDAASRTIGVSFIDLPKDPKDPLRAMLDSML